MVAKGAGVVAARIRELAETTGSPMVEDVPLARALHAGCEVGQEIPPQLYHAVAQVLAFVLSLPGRAARPPAGTGRPRTGRAAARRAPRRSPAAAGPPSELLRSGRRRPIGPSSQDGRRTTHHGRCPETGDTSVDRRSVKGSSVAQIQNAAHSTRPRVAAP